MQATARRLSVVSATSCARRRLIRDVRPRNKVHSAMRAIGIFLCILCGLLSLFMLGYVLPPTRQSLDAFAEMLCDSGAPEFPFRYPYLVVKPHTTAESLQNLSCVAAAIALALSCGISPLLGTLLSRFPIANRTWPESLLVLISLVSASVWFPSVLRCFTARSPCFGPSVIILTGAIYGFNVALKRITHARHLSENKDGGKQ